MTGTGDRASPSPHGLLTFPNTGAVRLTYALFYWLDGVLFIQSNIGLHFLPTVMQSKRFITVGLGYTCTLGPCLLFSDTQNVTVVEV